MTTKVIEKLIIAIIQRVSVPTLSNSERIKEVTEATEVANERANVRALYTMH